MPRFGDDSLADRLRHATHELHARAERSGIISELVRGRGSLAGYALFLRNLLPVYEAMERAIEAHRGVPEMAWLVQPAVYRTRQLESDLEAICGPGFREEVALLPCAERYALRISRCGADARETGCLVAHAYVRYLGDLNGGRTLARRLRETLGLGPEALSFYAYPEIAELDSFKQDYRAGFDAADSWVEEEATLAEALVAFELNIELSEAVHARCDVARGRP